MGSVSSNPHRRIAWIVYPYHVLRIGWLTLDGGRDSVLRIPYPNLVLGGSLLRGWMVIRIAYCVFVLRIGCGSASWWRSVLRIAYLYCVLLFLAAQSATHCFSQSSP